MGKRNSKGNSAPGNDDKERRKYSQQGRQTDRTTLQGQLKGQQGVDSDRKQVMH